MCSGVRDHLLKTQKSNNSHQPWRQTDVKVLEIKWRESLCTFCFRLSFPPRDSVQLDFRLIKWFLKGIKEKKTKCFLAFGKILYYFTILNSFFFSLALIKCWIILKNTLERFPSIKFFGGFLYLDKNDHHLQPQWRLKYYDNFFFLLPVLLGRVYSAQGTTQIIRPC